MSNVSRERTRVLVEMKRAPLAHRLPVAILLAILALPDMP